MKELDRGLAQGKDRFADGQSFIDFLYREVTRLQPLEAENSKLKAKLVEWALKE